jgi:membrane-bound ClpP family serine protease
MAGKDEVSALKTWLLVLASMIDDILILGLVFLLLWIFHVKITWPLILAAVLAIIVFAIIMHQAVIPALRRRKIAGSEGMIGATGIVIEAIAPKGTVEIKGEYWKATAIDGKIEKGRDVEVVSIKGLNLKVKEKKSG